MKALSITEPYASLIRDGVKTIETRSWRTAYRGPLLIHASATRMPKAWRENAELMQYVRNVQRGYLLCKADLVDCVAMTDEFIASLPEAERATGFYSVGRYAWILCNVEPIEPIPAKGRLGIWEYTGGVIMNYNESDIQSMAAALYDGGWRSHDREWLQEEYNLSDDEVDAIVKYLAEYEAQEVQS